MDVFILFHVLRMSGRSNQSAIASLPSRSERHRTRPATTSAPSRPAHGNRDGRTLPRQERRRPSSKTNSASTSAGPSEAASARPLRPSSLWSHKPSRLLCHQDRTRTPSIFFSADPERFAQALIEVLQEFALAPSRRDSAFDGRKLHCRLRSYADLPASDDRGVSQLRRPSARPRPDDV